MRAKNSKAKDYDNLYREIQKENEYYKSIIENNSFYIIKTDLEGKYTYMNPFFCKMLNLESKDWIGKDSLGIIISEDHQICIDAVMACFSEPSISHWVTLRKPVPSGVISTQWEFKMLLNEVGIPSEILCIGHDITSLILRQEELLIVNKELEFQNIEKEHRAAELALANIELAFQNREKENRAAELLLANIELAYQNKEKKNRAGELIITNNELVFQNERSAELVRLTEALTFQQKELSKANLELHDKTQLLIDQEEKVRLINQDLILLNQELEKRVVERTKALAESEIRFRNMMETIPQIAWTVTAKGEITYYNQQWYDYTGLSYEQTKNRSWRTIIHPEDLHFTLDQFRRIRKNRDNTEFQIRFKNSAGVYRWHLSRLMLIHSIEREGDGELLWVGTATDIHEIRLLQQQKDDFISIVSHELKTPLTSLQAALQLLNRMKDNPSNKMLPVMIEQANKSLKKVTVLVQDLLNATGVNEGQLKLRLVSISLSDAINECCDYIRLENIYTIVTEGDLDLRVNADPERFSQVIINLVNNAVKYAPASKVIKIVIEKANGFAKVSVNDEGPGITADNLLHLFDRYYRVETHGIQGSGLGLGLYICAEIIKKHNGLIGVNSELGKGSSFWFTLPT
jgi:PAS domain S-box-containing protein